ncbi:MAG: hypothetical protein ACRD3W_25700, partial [Terriglobales bacterium]
VLHHPFEPVDDAAKLATAPADPLSSRFTPSYGMVLNLLERHTPDEARDLIEHSFGQFMINQQLEPLHEQKMGWERELERLQNPLCPGELGDLPLYARRLDTIRSKHKQLKQMERGLKGHGRTQEGEQALGGVHQDIDSLLGEAYAMPCHGCPVQKACSKQTERVAQLQKRIKEFDRRILKETTKYWRTFEALANILRLKGYLNGSSPSELGKMAASIRGTNELFLTEVAISGILERLKGSEFAAIMTALVTEEGRVNEVLRLRVSPQVDAALERVHGLARKLLRTQRDFDVEIAVEFSPTFSGLTEMWADGATWDAMRLATSYDEGDVVRAIRRTVDLCRQFMRAPNMSPKMVEMAREAERLIARDEAKEDF